MPTLTFVSGNPSKIAEASEILGNGLETVSLDLDEIQELDIEKIVQHKVAHAFQIVQKPVFVDDVGLYIDAWNGFPGPLIKFVHKSGGMELMLKMLLNEKNRKATAKTAIGYHDGKTIHTFIGETIGEITEAQRGNYGFGWDSVFVPKGSNLTYAELLPEAKNMISQRRKALEKLKAHIQTT